MRLTTLWSRALTLALACTLAATAYATAPQETASDRVPRFEIPRATIWLDRSQVLPFQLGAAPTEDLTLPARVDPAGVIEILREPRTLAGQTTGYLRLRGLSQGTCTLHVGDVALEVSVRALGAQAAVRRAEPSFVAPVAGSVVWGEFAVGVEVPHGLSGTSPVARPVTSTVRLVLPDGQALEPLHSPTDMGLATTALFQVDAALLAAGPQVLRASVSESELEVGSSSLLVTVVHPAAETLLSGECEDTLDQPRPEAFGERPPRHGSSPSASQGGFVYLPTPNPQWVLPIEIPVTARYQLFVTARGDRGAGALPSVGLSIDVVNPIRGSARLVDRRWHRLPVGPPLELEAGARALGVRFLNESNVSGRSDRNLYLDRWELLRIDEPEVAVAVQAALRPGGPESGPEPPELSTGLWIGFERPLDGLVMNGQLSILAACTWSGPEDSPAPHVRLLVDDVCVANQQTARPAFLLDRAHLGEGSHEIVLEARLPDGRVARTPTQLLRVPGPVAASTARDDAFFSVLDERWSGTLDGVLDGRGEEVRQRVARPTQNTEAVLTLPEDLEGEFELLVESRAGGQAEPVRVRLEAQGETRELQTVEVVNYWSRRPAGKVQLLPGPKRLLVTLEPRDKQPQLRVRGIFLRRTRPAPDTSAPTARILYPAPGHLVHGVDAVIVEAFDDDALQATDILIDGRPQATYGHLPAGAGHLVLPLLLRDVAPGEHTLAVRVIDRAGNLAETAEQTFKVLEYPCELADTYPRALHLLDRFAFGPEPAELAEILTLGEHAWLEKALEESGTGDITARGLAATRHGDRLAYDAARLVLSHVLRTDNPVRARFTLWIEDHFSTWAGKTGAPSEWTEHKEFARLGLAPFGELLTASATSPTMLFYLDQQSSFAGRLNENYARELMELHTVGVHGGYTQEEVTALAHMLTGLTVANEAPANGAGNYLRRVLRFDPELGDGRPTTLLGWQFEETPAAERAERFATTLELLASHPSTAHFLCTKLVEHYVSAPASEELVRDLAAVFRSSGGDFRSVLQTLAEHPAFWAAAEEPRLARPLDYGLRVARTAGVPQVDHSLVQFLNASGMGLFDRATPDGYPEEDPAWADTNGLLQRWRWVQQVPWAVRNLVPNPTRNYRGGDPAGWRQRAVDHAAVRLTGKLLGPESNAAALDFLEQDEGPTWQAIDRLTVLICRMPEASLR